MLFFALDNLRCFHDIKETVIFTAPIGSHSTIQCRCSRSLTMIMERKFKNSQQFIETFTDPVATSTNPVDPKKWFLAYTEC